MIQRSRHQLQPLLWLLVNATIHNSCCNTAWRLSLSIFMIESSPRFFYYSRQRYPVLTCLQSQLTNIHHLSPQVVKPNINKRNITSSQYYFPGRECKIQVTLSINLSYVVSSLVRAELSERIHSIFIEEGTWMGFKAVVNFLTSAGDLIACKYSHLGISPYC